MIAFIYIIYSPLLNIFFAQDDFFLLAVSRPKNAADFLSFFIPRYDTVWYRPLSQQIFFFLGQRLFGLNAWAFHMSLLLTHTVNVILVYFFLSLLVKNRWAAMFGSAFYAFNPSHFLSLAWPAAYGFLLGPTFYLGVIIAYFKYLQTKKFMWYLTSFVLFLLSILAIELNIISVGVIVILELLFSDSREKKFAINIAKKLTPFFAVALTILIGRFLIFPPETIGLPYHFTFATTMVSSFIWYNLRASGLVQSLWLGESLKWIHLVSWTLFWLMTLTLATAGFNNRLNKTFTLSLILTVLGEFPFLLLPEHRSPHYLSYALIGVGASLSVLFSQRFNFNKLCSFFTLGLIFLIIFSWTGVKIEQKTHWIVKRAAIAKKLVERGIFEVSSVSEEYFSLGANYAKPVYQNR